ncbi:MAG TPA: hypothetical protein VGK67_14525 [Myxococcales bacterium]
MTETADPKAPPAPAEAAPVAEAAPAADSPTIDLEASQEEAAAPADPMPEVPPISLDRLPPNFRKHADPKSPVPLRGMAAKGLVPLSPVDMCLCLALLDRDPDPGVAASARKTAGGLPDKIISVALRDEGTSPRVLHFFANALAGKDQPLEYLTLNHVTHDATMAQIAAGTSSGRLLEIISNNQLRILRSEPLLRAVLTNPASSKALVDLTCDFTVRNGLCLIDLEVMIEAHVRIHGKKPAAILAQEAGELPPPPPDTAETLLAEFGEALTSGAAPPMEEGKRMNLTRRVSTMGVSDRIKLATLGNKEARTILLRDPNKLVQAAVIGSPRITDGEVMNLAHSKTTSDEVLRSIYMSREWTRQYSIKLALVKNPKVPVAIAMRFLGTLRESEVKDLATNKNVPSQVRMNAKKMGEKKK